MRQWSFFPFSSKEVYILLPPRSSRKAYNVQKSFNNIFPKQQIYQLFILLTKFHFLFFIDVEFFSQIFSFSPPSRQTKRITHSTREPSQKIKIYLRLSSLI